ncbi:MAG: prepilin-type N-terminal cleavage/methylation domain-containing protein [Phycisphaerales bacterium]
MKARAFTLIEVLVVVAVIAILIAILLPSLSKARVSARTTKCLANIRSLEIAQTIYADAYKGALVDVGLAHGGFGDASISWAATLSDYYDSPLSVRSPGDASSYWPTDSGGQGLLLNDAPRRTSYGMSNYLSRTYNPGLSPREPFDRLERIPRPDATVQFLLMTESGDFAVSDHPHVENWGDARRAPGVASSQVFIHKWGGGARSPRGLSNYGFPDGHAATLRFDAVYTDVRTNRFNPEIAS